MKYCIWLFFGCLAMTAFGQTTRSKLSKMLEKAANENYIGITDANGEQQYSLFNVGKVNNPATASDTTLQQTLEDIHRIDYEFYESSTTNIPLGTPTIINVDSQINPSPLFSLSAGGIMVHTDATIDIAYSVTLDKASGGTRANSECGIYIDGVAIPRSFRYGYHRSTTTGLDNIHVKITNIPIVNGQTITLQAQQIDGNGNLITVNNSSNLIITL